MICIRKRYRTKFWNFSNYFIIQHKIYYHTVFRLTLLLRKHLVALSHLFMNEKMVALEGECDVGETLEVQRERVPLKGVGVMWGAFIVGFWCFCFLAAHGWDSVLWVVVKSNKHVRPCAIQNRPLPLFCTHTHINTLSFNTNWYFYTMTLL